MILQVFSTLILSTFEGAIASFALLSVFTPLIMDAGGNAGGQTTTMIVRSISLDEFEKGDFKRVIWKELRIAACIASIIAVFVFGWMMFEMAVGIVDMGSSMETLADAGINFSRGLVMVIIAALVASTLFVTMVAARLVACMLPFLAKKIKLDPAVMCGPVTTTMVDVISLLAYFFLWTFLFGPQLGF
jgi:magnesium transporter